MDISANESSQQQVSLDSYLVANTAFTRLVWVTHQVVISALTDTSLAMGEFVVIKAQSDGFWKVLGRGRFN